MILNARVDAQFGEYRLLHKLGEGGAANVYLAVRRGPFGFRKLLVVKCLKPGLASDPEMREAFIAEAKLSARLNHANVAQVHEVFEEDGVPALVLDYLEGRSLAVLRRELGTALPLPLHVYILCEALRGLHYFHELEDESGTPMNAVHRDVSPQNLFVTYGGSIKVLDFGIAKVAGSQVTEFGIVKGKLSYMAPEQLNLDGSPRVERTADLFAIGIMLWEAVAGKPMWSGATDGEILRRCAEGQFPSLEAVVPDAPPRILAVVRRALERDPRARYSDAEAMREALLPYVDEQEPSPDEELRALLDQRYGAERSAFRRVVASQLDEPELPTSNHGAAMLSIPPTAQATGSLSEPTTVVERRSPPKPAGASVDRQMVLSRLGFVAVGIAIPLVAIGFWSNVAPTGTKTGALPSASGSAVSAVPSGAGVPTAPASVAGERAPSNAPAESASAAFESPSAVPSVSSAPGAIPQRVAACSRPLLIADFEAGRAEACSAPGRAGGQYIAYFDGTGTLSFPPGFIGASQRLATPRGTSQRALHWTGTKIEDWGAGVVAALNGKKPVDLSRHDGLSLWLRSREPTALRIGLATPGTLDKSYGGRCEPLPKQPCGDHYSVRRLVGPEWSDVRVSLASFRQEGWGKPATWERDKALELHISAYRRDAGKADSPLDFDVWIDDIELF